MDSLVIGIIKKSFSSPITSISGISETPHPKVKRSGRESKMAIVRECVAFSSIQ